MIALLFYTQNIRIFFIDIDKSSFIVHNELKYVGFNKVHIPKICQIIKPNNRLEFHSEYFVFILCALSVRTTFIQLVKNIGLF